MTEAPVHRIALPNPFFEGRTNAYVIVGDPLTLIDTGIGTDDAFCSLETGLRKLGLGLRDIRQIVLTHHHMDHFGQAYRLRDLSGAAVFIHEADHEIVTRYNETLPEYVDQLRLMLHRAGVPVNQVEHVVELFRSGAGRLARSVPATPLRDGQRVPVPGGELEVIHVPGHTLGCICLHYGRHLFSGDHVLPGITPNIGSEVTGSRLLTRYLDSLRRVRPLQTPDLNVLPGHGDPFPDLQGRVDALIAHHAKREDEMLALLRSTGPQTIHELATRMFGELRDYHIVLGAAETWAHLEKLIDEGRVTREGNQFRAV